MPLISAYNIHKTYRLGKVSVPVLRGLDFEVNEGEWVAVLGSSGSGKSTLLHILGALDTPDSKKGSVKYGDLNVLSSSGSSQNQYRNKEVGFIFQFYHLLPEMNVLENTTIPAMVRYGYLGYLKRRKEIRSEAQQILEAFGMGDRLKHRPNELSGGERQRVAIARALINDPKLVLADEPTGNLDAKTGSQILDVIEEMHTTRKKTLVMVTHDPNTAARANRIVQLEAGLIKSVEV